MATLENVYKISLDTKTAQNRLKVLEGGIDNFGKKVKKAGETLERNIGKKGSRAAKNFADKMKIADRAVQDLQWQAVVGSRKINAAIESNIVTTSRFSNALLIVNKRLREIKWQKIGASMTGAGRKLTTFLTLPLSIAGGAAIKFASDVEESINKVDVSFGESSEHVKRFSDTTLKRFGIARGSALDMAALFGDMGTSMGITQEDAAKMSTELVGLAGDLASFKNINISEVQTALSGIFTGETESLKRIGIVQTIENLEEFGRAEGLLTGKKGFRDLSQAEKTMLRYQFVIAKTANSQGDFERTGESAANQMRKFTEGAKELGEKFGKIILPFFTRLVELGNRVLDWLGKLNPDSQEMVLIFAGLALVLGPVLMLFGGMITTITTIVGIIGGPLLVVIASVIGAIAFWVTYWDDIVTGIEFGISKIVEYFWKAVRGIVGAAGWLIEKVNPLLQKIGLGMSEEFINNLTEDLDAKIAEAKYVSGSIYAPESKKKFALGGEAQSSEWQMQSVMPALETGGAGSFNYESQTNITLHGAGGSPKENLRMIKGELDKRDTSTKKAFQQATRRAAASET
jgi:hypothetical protein